MTLDAIDRIIAREVGELCWHVVPILKPELTPIARAQRYRDIWAPPIEEEMAEVKEQDPIVQYPVLLLDSDRQLDTIQGLIYGPNYGRPVRLSTYLSHLRRFLILQLTGGHEAAVRLAMRGIREFATAASQEELLNLIDLIWRGRWFVGSFEWGLLRLNALAGGSAEDLSVLLDDHEKLQTHAFAIIQRERQIKSSATSIDEWLHEIYSLLPTIHSILFALRKAIEIKHSDELEKLDRVLDEFQADIGTTLGIAVQKNSLLENYIVRPIERHETLDYALKEIRGVSRGRTIIPQSWYQAVERLVRHHRSVQTGDDLHALKATLLAEIASQLDQPDASSAFGRSLCIDQDPWMVLLQFETDDSISQT